MIACVNTFIKTNEGLLLCKDKWFVKEQANNGNRMFCNIYRISADLRYRMFVNFENGFFMVVIHIIDTDVTGT